ncbi:MAG: GNAT family N-acetyltransferase [Acidimicrobiia bacterium]|nr:GNAT family N-acetyltransferase [Acidimicrobiia bacterium]
MSELTVRPVTEEDVRDFAEWRYEPPYDVYSITEAVEEAVAYFLSPETNGHVILRDGELAAFCTFGADARVPGGDYSGPGLDIGLGVRPSLAGRGLGSSFVQAVIVFARQNLDDRRLRVSIAAENERALRVWSQAGFTETQRFQATKKVMGSETFVILESG